MATVGEQGKRFLVIGAGFSGSLLSAILARHGKQVTLIDHAKHPRFVIGESSTPAAGLILRTLVKRYGLSELGPLTRYGRWVNELASVRRGAKQGFSYFFHQADTDFQVAESHPNELLVAASSALELADTQWLRSDVDQFLCDYARQQGVILRDLTTLKSLQRDGVSGEWATTVVDSAGGQERLQFDWVVDASGQGEAVTRLLGLPSGDLHGLKTNTVAVFSHFDGVKSWDALLAEERQDTKDFPFPADTSAQHHVLEEGWLWCLRFDHSVTSAGLVLDAHSLADGWQQIPAEKMWRTHIASYPSLNRMFQDAQLSVMPNRFLKTQRLQRIAGQAAGQGWGSLPHTAGFIDPLHSTGIAHSMSGVERLADIFLSVDSGHQVGVDAYGEQVLGELKLIDLLVAGCYLALPSKRHFEAYCMLYFAAATTYEKNRMDSDDCNLGHAMFLADDAKWVTAVRDVFYHLQELAMSQNWGEPAQFEAIIRRKIKRYNHAGLCDAAVSSMYQYTAAM
ncbi:MAG: NAD(P)-binding protein [Planctomycetaceae bacterium]|nr:NAD(P)-binding protein [Planctomycetaceae bacterium]